MALKISHSFPEQVTLHHTSQINTRTTLAFLAGVHGQDSFKAKGTVVFCVIHPGRMKTKSFSRDSTTQLKIILKIIAKY